MKSTCILVIVALFSSCHATAQTLVTAAELVRATYDAAHEGQSNENFDLAAKVTYCSPNHIGWIGLNDESGAATVYISPTNSILKSLRPGMLARFRGRTVARLFGHVRAECDDVRILSQQEPPVAKVADADGILSGKFDNHVITITGTLREVFRDEIDLNYIYFVLMAQGKSIHAIVYQPLAEVCSYDDLIGTEMTVTGFCAFAPFASRQRIGRILHVCNPNELRVRKESRQNPFHAPDISTLRSESPERLSSLGRHKASGHIIAVWGRNVLVRTSRGELVRADINNLPMPRFGQCAEIVGFPKTDLYRINLSRGIWRPLTGMPYMPEPATECGARQLLINNGTRNGISVEFNGRAVRLNGVVRSMATAEYDSGRFYVEDEGLLVTVDASSCPQTLQRISVGCTVTVRGTCIVETDNWRSYDTFPKTTGILVVIRTPDDVHIISRPPWWTANRFWTLIALLIAILASITIWNRMLKQAVASKSNALEQEISKRITSDIKVLERTRLAVELHDALSQTLTGVAMEIRAAAKALLSAPDSSRIHLSRAERTVDSCRGELRNCIWDLRSDAIDAPDIEEAIARTLAPHLRDASLSVRFPVSRSRFTDNTMHAILRIIRELTVNAIRHGRAKAIRVAGTIENGRFIFSVRDNGCGFDPESAPGIDKGHFGLQGIRERIDKFEGDLDITRCAGGGTKVTVSLSIPTEAQA